MIWRLNVEHLGQVQKLASTTVIMILHSCGRSRSYALRVTTVRERSNSNAFHNALIYRPMELKDSFLY